MFEVDPGVLGLMSSAVAGATAQGYTFTLEGDLCQMSTQKQFLQGRGFDVGQDDVYPCLKPEDKERALKMIWEGRVEGWWHYLKQYEKFNICTEEEFRVALKTEIANGK